MSQENFFKSGRYMYLLAWVAFFFLVTALFYLKTSPSVKEAVVSGQSIELSADDKGHFHVKGEINHFPVMFMIDTGASDVAIPKVLADKMGVKGRYPVTIETASGEVEGLLTRVDSLSFGHFTLNNVKVVVMPSDSHTVLMGMNVLKKFSISQNQGKMIIKPGL